jgi:hypothetical protein
MDRQRWMVVFGIAALGLYSLSWFFKWMEYDGVNALRIAAVVPFAIGAGLWVYDWQKKNKAQSANRKRKTGWEDILDDEDEDQGHP